MECEVAEEEVKGILKIIASTGKFWYGFISNFPSSSLVWLNVVLHVYFDVPRMYLGVFCSILLVYMSFFTYTFVFNKIILIYKKNV